MKIVFFLLCFILALSVFSQTTQEEYNYLTKGYKEQIAKGLDTKIGYTIIDLGKWNNDLVKGYELRQCEFKALIKEGQTKPCATLLIYKRVTNNPKENTMYFCIPSKDADVELWKQTYKAVAELENSPQGLQAIVYALMRLQAE